MFGCKGRYDLIKPFMLLTGTKKLNKAKENITLEYLNLCDIVIKMKELYLTGSDLYHHFGMLLNELQILGFKVDDMVYSGRTADDVIKEQIDLLLQFLSFRYPFDEYDNKIGVHDIKTNKFIFIQP